MAKVTSEISMSLDGFVTGPNVGVGNGMGDDGERLHEARAPLPMQGGTTYTFVTDGIEAALELARAAAGDRNVGIWAERTSSGST
jgi:hypothetical protein